MALFSVICLTVILLVMHHLLNWGWRDAVKERNKGTDMAPIVFASTVVALLLTLLIIQQIIIWGKDLL